MLFAGQAKAQNVIPDSLVGKGKFWGQAFADLYTKVHADSLNRGVNNQYTNIAKGATAFQFRRIYFGYDYNLDKHFSAECLLSAEDDFTGGDLLGNNKFSVFLKWTNLQWRGIYPGATLAIGQMETPAFVMAGRSEPTWGYRSVERTISDMRRTPAFDLGARLTGTFVPGNNNYGYILMVGNGNGARPVTNNTTAPTAGSVAVNDFKWYYGDVYAKLMHKKILIDLYADYQPLTYQKNYHRTRQMTKLFVAYNAPRLTVGIEVFINTIQNDDTATEIGTRKKLDTLNTQAVCISAFVKGVIIHNKLGFFARYDNYNPNNNKVYDATKYSKFYNITSSYNPAVKEQFITAGFDYTPNRNIHIMPNIWYNQYTSSNSTLSQHAKLAKNDYDMVLRLTFYWRFSGNRLNENIIQKSK